MSGIEGEVEYYLFLKQMLNDYWEYRREHIAADLIRRRR